MALAEATKFDLPLLPHAPAALVDLCRLVGDRGGKAGEGGGVLQQWDSAGDWFPTVVVGASIVCPKKVHLL